MKKIRENTFTLALVTFPFLLILSILKIHNILKINLYNYLILFMSIIFIIAFIFSLFFALDEILNSNNKKRVVLLILFPIIYLPIYYTKYIYKNERVFGYATSILSIVLLCGLFFSVKNYVTNYMLNINRRDLVLKSTYDLLDKNKEFSMKINSRFACTNKLGDYVISCDDNSTDSFIGIYRYKKNSFSEGELDDIMDYHLEETIKVIKEKNYTYNVEKINNFIRVTYNDMVVLIERKMHMSNNNTYCLVIIHETSQENENIIDFENNIENIEFLV